ncbi:hypothetical protein [uncultured Sphaerochaeta sp.]|uniref:hypothetical protein n=1 Tax=uncultured Sphaerochaeta sp. TaxID=886478 RepID=UPI0029CA4206|nr:hypothetical protein [uncultured Sphaerochaeta sp.]
MPKNKEIIPANKPWKYEESVETAKPLVAMYKKVSLDLVRELYAAREALSNSGFRTDRTSGNSAQGSDAEKPCENLSKNEDNLETKGINLVSNETRFQTFQTYLDEIGLSKPTAYRWLALYSPQEDKLYTPEEMDQKLEELFQKIRKKREKEFGWTPEGWTPALERKYTKWLQLQNTQESIEEKGYSQAELFSREYFNLLARQMQDAPSAEEVLRFNDLCEAYEGRVTDVVKIEDQITIVQVVEKALSLFPSEKRPLVARSVASIINDLSANMEEGK